MAKTKIEYLTHTWNPIVMRCSKVSAGCENCWHLRMCHRMANNPAVPDWKREIYAGNSSPTLDLDMLYKLPSKPSVIGVQFMGDLFHVDVHDSIIREVWLEMIRHPLHKFFVLTKRPERMQQWIRNQNKICDFPELKQVWLGVSVEDQKTADERIPILLNTPAAHRWVSVEPMLKKVDLLDYIG